MSLTKLFLAGKNLIILGQGELISDILAGDRTTANLYFSAGTHTVLFFVSLSMGSDQECAPTT